METSSSAQSPVEIAVGRFRKPPVRLNCAQAVVAGFSEQLSLPEAAVHALSGLGGGRADAGECGALYSAKHLIRDPEAQARIERDFVALAGSPRCREIRELGQHSCAACVRTACELVEAELSKSKDGQ